MMYGNGGYPPRSNPVPTNGFNGNAMNRVSMQPSQPQNYGHYAASFQSGNYPSQHFGNINQAPPHHQHHQQTSHSLGAGPAPNMWSASTGNLNQYLQQNQAQQNQQFNGYNQSNFQQNGYPQQHQQNGYGHNPAFGSPPQHQQNEDVPPPPPPQKKKSRDPSKSKNKDKKRTKKSKALPPSPQQAPPSNQWQPQNNQSQQPIVNSYNNMSNPAAVYQSMHAASMYGSNMNMVQMQQMQQMQQQQQQGGGSNRNLMQSQQPPGPPSNIYAKQLSAGPMQNQGYEMQPQAPTTQFVQQYGPYGYPSQTNFYGQSNTQFYPQQPQGGGDSIVPPPPMVQAPNGEMVPTKNAKKKKGKKKKKRHTESQDGGKKRRRKSDKHKSHRSSSKGRKKKRDKNKGSKSSGSTSKDESPPPPPPPSSPNNLTLPGQQSMATSHPHDSDDDGSSSSDSTESASSSKKNASDTFRDKVGREKKKKGHNRFESKNQFIRRRPVSGVPMSVQKQMGLTDDKTSSHLKLISAKRSEKSQQTIQFLKECLMKEVLFSGMDDCMITEIVDVMYRVDCPMGECIIRQNEYGDAYFVIQTGAFDIIHQEHDNAKQKVVGEMLPGKAFGEGSLLYSIPRAATLKATKSCIVWALDATKFLEIRQKISQQVNDKTSKIVRFLKKVDLFKKYHHQDLVSIGQATQERRYTQNSRIVNQGDDSKEFYLIKTGAAIAVIADNDGKEKTVKTYGDGDYFGERGIYKNEKRAASIIATQHTKCYVINSADFRKLIANPLSQQLEETIRGYDDVAFDNGIKRPFRNLVDCKLEDFEILGVLGVGSFGRVSLVRAPNTTITYSLKKVRKNKVVETQQQEHVRNERAVLATLDSDFCVKLFGTYRDKLNIYFLMEPVLGGELFTVLRWNKRFSEKTGRFYAACVVLAFEHLHSKNIIYRDLKPENLLISSNGYCKLVDFGFAKKRNNSSTLCGTPEYLSPEVIQNFSQGFAVDWWALGIFIYEMVIGHAPFQDDPQVKMYEKILTLDVEFPDDPKLTPRVEHLICGLLEKNAFQRLGAGSNGTQQILNHPWFHGLDWDQMRAQDIPPPYVPNINGTDDLSHYDVYPEENIVEELDPDPSVYDWCQDF